MNAVRVRYGWLGVALLFIVMQLIYVIVPVDAIPDVVPILGWLDDLAVILTGISATTAAGGYALWPRKGDAEQIEAGAETS
ncbi:MAG: DUF1232 domain-containing protein [Myxococcales bacterium]|nr:DUF1232 domain-containing protein [Myxococcales bacterium]